MVNAKHKTIGIIRSVEKKAILELFGSKVFVAFIQNISNKKFKEKELDCYLMDRSGPSFSHPLTLKVRTDSLLMLVILIHELVHHVTEGKITKEKYGKINNLTGEVIKTLGLKADYQLAFIRKVV